jgi:outer membrane protein
MKKVVLLLAIICATGISSFSQQVKLGHINGSELIKHMKEYKDAVEDLKKKSTELQSVIEYMSVELDSLQNDYGKNSTTWAPVIREMKEKNIIQKNQNLQEFQQTAQSQLQMDEQERMNPILFKANQAIEKVAKANGYTYILDTSSGTMLYVGGDDVTALVCAELGIEDFTAELKKREEEEKIRMSGQKPVPGPGQGTGVAPGMTPKK